MMSGRGLGHTGGTLDKLAAIPGFRTDLDLPRVREALQKVGAALFAADGHDRAGRPDALRAAGRDGHGRVARAHHGLDPLEEARLRHDRHRLRREDRRRRVHEDASRNRGRSAASLVDTTRAAGRQASGWITDMSRPLGRAVGNALEAEEVDPRPARRRAGRGSVRELCLAARRRDARGSRSRTCSRRTAPQRLEDGDRLGPGGRVVRAADRGAGGRSEGRRGPVAACRSRSRSVPAVAPRSGFVPFDRDRADGVPLDRHRLRPAPTREDTIDSRRDSSSRRPSATASRRASRSRSSVSASGPRRGPASRRSSPRCSRSATIPPRRRRSSLEKL